MSCPRASSASSPPESCARPSTYVAQERLGLSTAPCWNGDGISPRHLSIRAFLSRREDGGFEVMPGGLTRVGKLQGFAGGVDATRRWQQGHLGARHQRAERAQPVAAAGLARRHRAQRRRSAEPRRGQHVLDRPLHGARGDEHAPVAQPAVAPGGRRRGPRARSRRAADRAGRRARARARHAEPYRRRPRHRARRASWSRPILSRTPSASIAAAYRARGRGSRSPVDRHLARARRALPPGRAGPARARSSRFRTRSK